jgi:hypothetical protein
VTPTCRRDLQLGYDPIRKGFAFTVACLLLNNYLSTCVCVQSLILLLLYIHTVVQSTIELDIHRPTRLEPCIELRGELESRDRFGLELPVVVKVYFHVLTKDNVSGAHQYMQWDR